MRLCVSDRTLRGLCARGRRLYGYCAHGRRLLDRRVTDNRTLLDKFWLLRRGNHSTWLLSNRLENNIWLSCWRDIDRRLCYFRSRLIIVRPVSRLFNWIHNMSRSAFLFSGLSLLHYWLRSILIKQFLKSLFYFVLFKKTL